MLLVHSSRFPNPQASTSRGTCGASVSTFSFSAWRSAAEPAVHEGFGSRVQPHTLWKFPQSWGYPEIAILCLLFVH